MADVTYPYTRFRYTVEAGDTGIAAFSEITGYDASIDVVEYREGNMKAPTPLKMPGIRKYSNVILKWGVTSSKAMYDWMSGSFEGDIKRQDVTVTLNDETGKAVASWQIISAWPAKYTAPEFNATASEVAIETLELAHEGMTRKT